MPVIFYAGKSLREHKNELTARGATGDDAGASKISAPTKPPPRVQGREVCLCVCARTRVRAR